MDILLLVILAIVTFFIVKKINEKTGLAYAIAYIVFGIIIGVILRKNGMNSLGDLLPHTDNYSNLLLLLMFFSAGFSINTDAVLKSGPLIPKLSFIPSIVETFVVGTLMYFLVKYFGAAIDLQLNIFETIAIAGILALSSAANVVPYCIELIQGKYKSKNNIQNTMVVVSVTDGFSTLPIIMLALYLAIANFNGTQFTAGSIIMIIVGVLVALLASIVVGFIIGRLIVAIAKPIMQNLVEDKDNTTKQWLVPIGIFALSYLIIVVCSKIPVIGAGVSSLSVLIVCAIGAGINHYDKTGASKIISATGNKVFAIIGTPIIFLSVGSKLDLKTLLNPNMLIIGVVTCCVAVLVKGAVGALMLDKKTYTDDERKFVFACFIPKGLTLVNFSVIFAGLAVKYDATSVINFMIMLAGITIIITIPTGVTVLAKAKDKWFTQ